MRLYLNQKLRSEDWRRRLFEGCFFLWSQSESAIALCDYAKECIQEHFDTPDPLTDYRDWPVDKFIEKTAALKSHFTNSLNAKEHIRSFVQELSEDPTAYLFDVPRLRVVPNYDYLHTGVSYNYAPHRDTWYGAPTCQINTWMPVFPIEPEEAMAIYPAYFSQYVENTSAEFDLKHWALNERPTAVNQKTAEMRTHPLPTHDINRDSEFLYAGTPGDILVFSGQHIHGSLSNRAQRIRFSIDFRLYSEEDLQHGSGPEGIDDASTNKEFGLSELYRVADFSRYQEEEKA